MSREIAMIPVSILNSSVMLFDNCSVLAVVATQSNKKEYQKAYVLLESSNENTGMVSIERFEVNLKSHGENIPPLSHQHYSFSLQDYSDIDCNKKELLKRLNILNPYSLSARIIEDTCENVLGDINKYNEKAQKTGVSILNENPNKFNDESYTRLSWAFSLYNRLLNERANIAEQISHMSVITPSTSSYWSPKLFLVPYSVVTLPVGLLSMIGMDNENGDGNLPAPLFYAAAAVISLFTIPIAIASFVLAVPVALLQDAIVSLSSLLTDSPGVNEP